MAGRFEDRIRCSFCGKTDGQVRKLIAGPSGAYICDECVDICAEIIEEELKGRKLPADKAPLIKRVIHTSADFEYADTLCFSDGAMEQALGAIRKGASIVTDTRMGYSGINKRVLEKYGGQVYCFMGDEDVAEAEKKNGTTRAVAAIDKAAAMEGPLIFAVGNAPTALIRL